MYNREIPAMQSIFLNVSSNFIDLKMYFHQIVGRIKKQKRRGEANIYSIIGLQFKMTINFSKILFQNNQNVITKETGGFAK